MKHLNSFNLVHRISIRKVCVAAFIALFGAFATFFAVKTINDQAMAITGDGERVNVSFDGNSWTNYGPWRTPIFTVSAGGTNYIGTCGSPKMNTTSGEFGAQPYSLDNQQEKILIFYIYTQDSSNPLIAHAQRTFFGQSPVNRTNNYAALHAIVGYLNMGRHYGDGDMSADELSFLNWATDTLTHVVNGDSSTSDLNDVWIMAKNYRLFGLKQAEIQAQGMQDVLWIENNAQFGNLKIHKCDGANETCTAQGSASLSGVTFTVKYAGNDRIYDQKTNKFYENGTVVTTVTTGNDGTATVSNLPLGTYLVEETSTTNPSYVLKPQSKTITLVNNGATTEETFNNQVARGDVHFTKVNSSDNNSPMANVAFRITSKTTGENHIVVSNSNGVVNTATNAHNNHTNGYDGMGLSTITYKGYGTWFGSAPVDNSLGALPYDSYDIVELNCDANQYCHDVSSQKKSFTITSNNQNVDLGKWTNDCPVFSLATTATDNADGDKMIANISNAKIKDKIDYCLSAGGTFTIKGVLMDKATGQALTINGQTIEKTITVTPTNDCGTVNMVFDLDASELAGKQIVVYEYAYQGTNEVASHTNINDAGQTVHVVSLATTATDNADGDKMIANISNAKIKDKIDYCLSAGGTFTIKGVLMDKATGQALTINGQTIEKTITVTPTSDCGTTNMVFDLNASELAGKQIVVYEYAYQGTDEVASHTNINDTGQTVSVVSLETIASNAENGNKAIEDRADAKISDIVGYCLTTGQSYTLKGILMDKSTGEPLLINGSTVEKSTTITPTTACGTTEIIFDLDASGLAGKRIVVYEYIYQNNTLIESHEDINDTAQTVSVAHLETSVVDAYDGDKSVLASDEATVIDTIKYCLDADSLNPIIGHGYIIKGILMDKSTGEPLLINGKTVEQSIDLEPGDEPCGETNMTFKFDASHLDGAEIVVFESAYLKTSLVDTPNEWLIISHEDIDDEAQTFNIYLPPPDTGLFTVPETGNVTSTSTGFNWLAITFGIVIVVSGVYLGYHFLARRRFFGKIK